MIDFIFNFIEQIISLFYRFIQGFLDLLQGFL